jgi:hypothetical protein
LRIEISCGEMRVIRVPGIEMRIDSTIVYARGKLSTAAEEFLGLVRERRRDPRAATQRAARKIGIKVLSLAPLAAWIYSQIGQVVEDAALIVSSAI